MIPVTGSRVTILPPLMNRERSFSYCHGTGKISVTVSLPYDQSKGAGAQQPIGHPGTAPAVSGTDHRQSIQIDAGGGQVGWVEKSLRSADPGHRLPPLLSLTQQGTGDGEASAAGQLHQTSRRHLQRPALRQLLFEMGCPYQTCKRVGHRCTLPYSPWKIGVSR